MNAYVAAVGKKNPGIRSLQAYKRTTNTNTMKEREREKKELNLACTFYSTANQTQVLPGCLGAGSYILRTLLYVVARL